MTRFFSDYTSIHPFIPVFIFLLVVAAFGAGTLIISAVIRPHRPDPEKLSPYECGIPPLVKAGEHFSIRFYIIAILFLLFDVEAPFLFPWAVVSSRLGLFGFIEMMLFLLILLVGYVYAWKKGALEWV
ncbi:MAG: NADH-quinone oxidoreductase subunit A [bacterium]